MVEKQVAYLFPGQGSQSVGMGRDLYDNVPSAREIFQQADSILNFPLTKLCFEGPEDELRQTINAQPALVVAAYAALQAAGETGKLPAPAFLAGHSLGEYTALAAAGAMDFATAVRLARERGRLMYEAGQVKAGSMAAVMGMAEALLTEVCREGGTWVANINCPGQLVISGGVSELARTIELIKAKGSFRTIPLSVSGAFHTPLMQPAYDGMQKTLAGVSFVRPQVPVVANTSAQPLSTAAEIAPELLQQLCNCVQWQRSIEYMLAQGVTTFIEIGPGKVLTGLVKRINKEAATINLGDLASIRSLGQAFG